MTLRAARYPNLWPTIQFVALSLFSGSLIGLALWWIL